ncbi:MAG: response regulator [Butyrivibrio sp.]|nr:response regulator [Butyrivibrio sp.]
MTYHQGAFEKGVVLKKILLVDDDVIFRHLLAELLNKEFETYEAVGVCDALKMLETITVDLICSDYNMRDGTGLDLLQVCKERNIGVTFMLMSADESNGLSRKAELNGITFCEKTDHDFINIIKKILNKTGR